MQRQAAAVPDGHAKGSREEEEEEIHGHNLAWGKLVQQPSPGKESCCRYYPWSNPSDDSVTQKALDIEKG